MEEKFKGTYGKSSKGNYFVFDTLGVPHPYCIGTRHIGHAQSFGGMLSKEAIESGEKYGINCEICLKNSHKGGKVLTFAEHEQALCIKCLKDFKKSKTLKNELHKYLLSIKKECEKNKYTGFVFVSSFKEGENETNKSKP